MEMSVTLIITIITCIISFWALSSESVMQKLIFNPVAVTNKKEYYRFLTSGFIHADFIHLAFNMLSFYSFGTALEKIIFSDLCVFNKNGIIIYVVLYLTAIVASEIPAYFKHKYNSSYLSLGASGAVSAIIFATVLFFPQLKLGLMFIPIPVPGYIFCFLYLVISTYLDKSQNSRINHSAHIFGALYGVAFTFIAVAIFGNIDLIENFLTQVKQPLNNLLRFNCKYQLFP
jgi:membrane associated rhomboid family serine protease